MQLLYFSALFTFLTTKMRLRVKGGFFLSLETSDKRLCAERSESCARVFTLRQCRVICSLIQCFKTNTVLSYSVRLICQEGKSSHLIAMAFSCLLEGIFILQLFCLNLSTSKRGEDDVLFSLSPHHSSDTWSHESEQTCVHLSFLIYM